MLNILETQPWLPFRSPTKLFQKALDSLSRYNLVDFKRSHLLSKACTSIMCKLISDAAPSKHAKIYRENFRQQEFEQFNSKQQNFEGNPMEWIQE